jgi:predicted nuclease of predicted toxin-antitoxin system
MPAILLDQNIPEIVGSWLASLLSGWQVVHVKTIGLLGAADDVIYRWAQENAAVIATYDEDFADARTYPLGRHNGIIRLRVWPTTIENTQRALMRLIASIPPAEWPRSLIIIDNHKIRRRLP